MLNPYESPTVESEADSERPRSPWRGLRLAFCVINFAVATLFTLSTASQLLAFTEAADIVSVLVSLLLASPFAIYAALELVAVFMPAVEWILGYANLICASLLCIGVLLATLAASTHPRGEWNFITIVLPIWVAVLSYLFTCGVMRLRHSRQKTVVERVEVEPDLPTKKPG
ncbi:hypothetical protein [Anatilimnocola floriformis]|uniref:hypothetical protein n=1 Tax=Anatilimnocola floriformis TaxID=2948575 RepID=UPI0020C303EA|nr:hypothetical protein [Anatilimnocola floriformis]